MMFVDLFCEACNTTVEDYQISPDIDFNLLKLPCPKCKGLLRKKLSAPTIIFRGGTRKGGIS